MVSALGHNNPGCSYRSRRQRALPAWRASSAVSTLTQTTLAQAVGPIVFVVVVVGGLGSLSGALIASMLIGIVQTFAVAIDYSLVDLFRGLGVTITRASPIYELLAVKLATAAPIVPYLLLVLMLIVRPRGLLGTRDV